MEGSFCKSKCRFGCPDCEAEKVTLHKLRLHNITTRHSSSQCEEYGPIHDFGANTIVIVQEIKDAPCNTLFVCVSPSRAQWLYGSYMGALLSIKATTMMLQDQLF